MVYRRFSPASSGLCACSWEKKRRSSYVISTSLPDVHLYTIFLAVSLCSRKRVGQRTYFRVSRHAALLDPRIDVLSIIITIIRIALPTLERVLANLAVELVRHLVLTLGVQVVQLFGKVGRGLFRLFLFGETLGRGGGQVGRGEVLYVSTVLFRGSFPARDRRRRLASLRLCLLFGSVSCSYMGPKGSSTSLLRPPARQ